MVTEISTKFQLLLLLIVCSEANSDVFKCRKYENDDVHERLQNKGSLTQLTINEYTILKTIREDTFKEFTNLTHLTVIGAGVEEIDHNAFSHLINLEYLDLSQNELSKLFDYMFEDMSNLQKLILNHNSIKIIDSSEFSNLTNLRELHVKKNELKSIYRTTFIGLTNVEIIDLSGNPILYIQENSFDSCNELKRLILESTNHLVIQSLWSSPSNIEIIFVSSKESTEDMLKSAIRNINFMASKTKNLGAYYYDNDDLSSRIGMPMIITITIVAILIIVAAVGMSVHLKKKTVKKSKSEVATVNHNGMSSVISSCF